MKKNNPHTPILIREASGTTPKVFARYGKLSGPLEKQKVEDVEYGVEKQATLQG